MKTCASKVEDAILHIYLLNVFLNYKIFVDYLLVGLFSAQTKICISLVVDLLFFVLF